MSLGDITTVNINLLQSGLQHNVIPNQAEACIDMRIAPSVDLEKFEKQVYNWVEEEGGTIETIQKSKSNNVTLLTKENEWWQKLLFVAEKRNISLEPEIFPAATDARYIRQLGLPALGISPFRHTPVLLHDHDEYLKDDIFLEGIAFYTDLIDSFTQF